ncbi:MAG: hydroxysqualene dehydroxylase HpnE [Acidimicrobiales bacterium]
MTPAPEWGAPPRRVDAVVVGGGLAGITPALDLADAGAQVVLLERRRRLGGLTWSFEHDGRWIDNGQHVFLRCCEAYLGFLQRIGSAGDVELQARLDVTAVRPAAGPGRRPRVGTLRRSDLPAPLQLGPALLRYPHLRPSERFGAARAALALRRVDLADPDLDSETFAAWLGRHGQGAGAVAALWDLITVATVNLPASEASLAVAAMVFKTGLLTDPAAADIGWARRPLGHLHGDRASDALRRAGVEVLLGRRAGRVEVLDRPRAGHGRFSVPADGVPADGGEPVEADAVVVAVPHTAAADVLPPGAVSGQDTLNRLGTSAIVNVHVVYDRPVTDRPLLAGVGSVVQWVFDRTVSSGLAPSVGGTAPQCLAVSLSAADHLLARHPDAIAAEVLAELTRLLPAAAGARVLDTLVTKERSATFRAVPGTAALRPGAAAAIPGVAVAGAWTATGWPATMEGAVRSGHAAAAVALRALPDLTQSEEVA